MKKMSFVALVVVGVLAVTLALGLAAGLRPQAQAPAASAALDSDGQAPAAMDRTGSSEPGYVPTGGGEPEPGSESKAILSLRVAGSMLRPRGSDVGFISSDSGGCVYVSSGDTAQVWNTPIYPPQGATVSELRMYVYDTSTAHCGGWFTVYGPYGEVVDEWGATSNTNAGESYWVATVPNHVVDYDLYSYAFNWRPFDDGTDMKLCGFRLDYTPPSGTTFLPGVMRDHTP